MQGMKKKAGTARGAASGRGGRGIAGPLTLLGRGGTGIPASPECAKLEAFPNTHRHRDYWIEFDCPEFTSLCPVTGQPDFGRITVRYVANRLCLESKSLKLYLHSFRNRGAFHEEVVNVVLDDIVRAVKPRRATVAGDFRPRGGIAIRVEAAYP
jgi:7-cyano-7-deazaguanine reductase